MLIDHAEKENWLVPALKNAILAGMALVVALAGFARAEPFDIQAEYIACLEHEEYAIGGSMAGDCFLAQARVIEADIDTLLHQVSKRYCSASDRETLERAQSLWLEHLKLSCTLIEKSPDNTPSYIAGSACRLDTARKRLETLRILENNAYTWCSDMRFLSRHSQFGDPANLLDTTGIGRIEGVDERGEPIRMLDIFGDLEGLFSLDLTNCSYCEADADCSQGLFYFEYPVANRSGRPTAGLPVDKALLHACRKPDGIAFDLVAGLLTEPRIVETREGWQAFDWLVDNGRIILTDGADNTVSWSSD